MLENILKLNPYHRWSASELLKLQIFDEFRDPEMEASAPFKILLEIDRDEAFDYEDSVSHKYSMSNYKEMILTEV